MRFLPSVLLVAAGVLSAAAVAVADPVVPGYSVETYATGVHLPVRMSFDAAGTLYVGTDNGLRRIYHVGSGGSPVDPYGSADLPDPDAVLVDAAGVISGTPGSVLVGGLTSAPAQGQISAILPDQSVVTVFGPSTSFLNPTDMKFDSNNRLVFSDFSSRKVMVSNGAFPTALFSLAVRPRTIAIDSLNRIFLSTDDGRIRLHAANGAAVNSSFATGLSTETVIALGPGGPRWGNDLYALSNGSLLRFDQLGGSTVLGTGFGTIWDLEFGPDGGLYLTDSDADRILRIVPEPATGILLAALGVALLRRR